MRAIFLGTDSLTLMAARELLKRDHEVVIIERDREKIEALSDELDVGFVHGDGSKPAILKEAAPEQTDIFYCLTENDQTNIIASLVGRSLGMRRVVTRIEDPEFEHICIELGLEDTVIPARTIGRYLADMFEGRDLMELSSSVRDEAAMFSFVAAAADRAPPEGLELPPHTRLVCLYRSDKFLLPADVDRIEENDEVVFITRRNALTELQRRWPPKQGRLKR